MILAMLMVVFIAGGFVLNLVSVAVLVTDKKLHTIANYYQGCLYFWTLVSVIFSWSYPLFLLYPTYLRNPDLVALVAFGEHALTIGIISNVSAQGCDRYLSLCRPLEARSTSNHGRTITVILVSVVSSSLLAVPFGACRYHEVVSPIISPSFVDANSSQIEKNLLQYENRYSTSSNQSYEQSQICRNYLKVTPYLEFIFLFCVPLILNIGLFVGIVRQLRRNVPIATEAEHRLKSVSEKSLKSNTQISIKKVDDFSRKVSLGPLCPEEACSYAMSYTQVRRRRNGTTVNKYNSIARRTRRATSERKVPRISIKGPSQASMTSDFGRFSFNEQSMQHGLSIPSLREDTDSNSSSTRVSRESWASCVSDSVIPMCMERNIATDSKPLSKVKSDEGICNKRRTKSMETSRKSDLCKRIRRLTEFNETSSLRRQSFQVSEAPVNGPTGTPPNFKTFHESLQNLSRVVSNQCYATVFPNTVYEFKNANSLQKQKSNNIPQSSLFTKEFTSITGETNGPRLSLSSKGSVKSQRTPTWLWKNRMKAVKNLALVIFVFVVEWLPFHVIRIHDVVMTFNPSYTIVRNNLMSDGHIFIIGGEVIIIAFLNTLLHCTCSERFRQAFLNLLQRCLHQCFQIKVFKLCNFCRSTKNDVVKK